MRGTHNKPGRGFDESKTPRSVDRSDFDNYSFIKTTCLKMANVVISRNGNSKEIAKSELEKFEAKGWELVPTEQELEKAPKSKAAKRTTSGGLEVLTRSEADTLRDQNLENSFGMPSELEAFCKKAKSVGKIFEDECEVVAIVKVPKKAPKTGYFPAVQVEWNGKRFLTLDPGGVEEGDTVEFKCPETDKTRSGFSVELIP